MQPVRVRHEIKQNKTLCDSTCKVKQKNYQHAHKPKQWQKNKTSTILLHFHATIIYNAFIVQSLYNLMLIVCKSWLAQSGNDIWHMCNTFCCKTGISNYFQKALNYFNI